MVKLRHLTIGCILIAAVGCWFLFPSEESRIRKTFAAFATTAEKTGPEHLLSTLAKAKAFAAFIEPGAVLDIPERDFHAKVDTETLVRQMAAVRAQASTIRVGFENISVTIDGDGTEADTSGDLLVRGTSGDYGFDGRDTRAFEARLRKNPDTKKWRFSRIRIVPIVEK